MKTKFLQTLLPFLILLTIPLTIASKEVNLFFDFKVDGLYYNILSEEDATVEITYEKALGLSSGATIISTTYYGPKFKGNLEIPSHVKVEKDGEIREYTVIQIGDHTFDGNDSLTSIILPNTVKNIEAYSFNGCKGLKSILIPNSVTTIKTGAFSGCTGITSVNYDAVSATPPTSSEYAWFKDCVNITDFFIGNNVEYIPDYLCYGLSKIQTMNLPNSLIHIGSYAFSGCTGLTSVNYEAENVTGPSSDCYAWFKDSGKITTFSIGNTVKSIPRYLCYGLSNIQSITIPNSVTSIGSYAFSGCSGLTSVVVPNSVNYVGSSSFSGCKNAVIKAFPNPYSSLKEGSGWKQLVLVGGPLYEISNCNPHQESIDLVFAANNNYEPAPEGYENIEATEFGIKRDYYGDYPCNSDGKFTMKNLYAYKIYYFIPYTKYSDGTTLELGEWSILTHSLNLNLASKEVLPSTISAQFGYKMEDAVFQSDYITYNGEKIPGQKLSLSGLKPNTTYSAKYTVSTKGGSTETQTFSFTTPALELKMLTPYSVTSTNTIVAAETNMSDQETSAGFQWKKYDAPSTLAPKEAFAAIYDGRLEGYIKNLQSTSYYNVRAFYKDAAGNYTYTDWVTFDPSDFSYFEPTVHTYPANEVSASSATVKGYVLPGSDEILKQGIEYWKVGGANAPMKVMSPLAASSKDTVFATGQVMIVTLNNLKPGTDYCYRAFVTTQAGTTYGEEQTFTTGIGVGDVNADGVVNVSDVTALVNKILQSADTFESVCDINSDGVVNVSDVTALVNIILNNSSAAKKHAIEAGIQSDEPIAPTTSVAATAIQAL